MYIQRLRLSKLGYTEHASELDAYTADMLLVVDGVLSKLRAEELSKK